MKLASSGLRSGGRGKDDAVADELLEYYNRELAYLHQMGAEFAAAHPKIAGRLQLSPESTRDPHVGRLIEAFALLNARTARKLDDDFPELSEALLNVLYPHYLAPMPSAAIVQLQLDRNQGDFATGYSLARGATIESEPIDGQPCRFRTCYDVKLWPIELKAASFKGHPYQAPRTRWTGVAPACLRIDLQAASAKAPLNQLPIEKLRFFLKGTPQYVHQLYELLLNNTQGLAIGGPTERDTVLLDRRCVKAVGFERDETLLPDDARGFRGYRLLSEYFSFAEKFLFVDVELPPGALARTGASASLYWFLGRYVPDLERNVTADSLQLGCTPVINLFKQRAEPITLSQTTTEYHVQPDARRPIAHEVYSIDRVTAVSPDGESVEYQPFYSVKHGADARGARTYWQASRRRLGYAGGQVDRGTEVYLTLVDLDFSPSAPANWTLDVETTCLNRDLPNRLPFGGGQPRLQLAGGGPISRVTCVTAPTETLRPALKRGTLWRLISHLSLNHLSLVADGQGAQALREILKLYDFADSPETHAMIEGLIDVRSRRVTGRVPDATASGFCRGLEVTLTFDEQRFAGAGVYLLASVLERFLGLYASINSFTKTIATTNKREEPLCVWPPRAGELTLL